MKKPFVFVLGMVVAGCLSWSYQGGKLTPEPALELHKQYDIDRNQWVYCNVGSRFGSSGIDCDWDHPVEGVGK